MVAAVPEDLDRGDRVSESRRGLTGKGGGKVGEMDMFAFMKLEFERLHTCFKTELQSNRVEVTAEIKTTVQQ
eukprot:1977976-Pyramimonas_sp.AAC.1